MRHIADRFTATLDANVLYPFLVRDVLLSFAEAGLYRPIWSAEIMSEWSSHLIKDKPDKKEKILRTVELMTAAFPEAMIDGYQRLVGALSLPDPDDRHVLAAAIRSGSSVIVTRNLKDFPSDRLAPYGIEVQTADDFVLNTVQLYTTDAVAALRIMRGQYDSPPMTPEQLQVALIADGLVSTAAELKRYLGSL